MNKVRLVVVLVFKREKPAILEIEFSNNCFFWVIFKNPPIVFYDLKFIEVGVKLAFKVAICLFTCGKTIIKLPN